MAQNCGPQDAIATVGSNDANGWDKDSLLLAGMRPRQTVGGPGPRLLFEPAFWSWPPRCSLDAVLSWKEAKQDTSNQQSSILAFLLPLSKHLLSLVFLYSRGVRVLPGLTLNPPCLHPLQSLMPKEKQENKLKKKVGVSRKNPAAPCGLNITRYLTRGGHNMLFHIHAVLCFCKLFLLHRMLYPMCCYHP